MLATDLHRRYNVDFSKLNVCATTILDNFQDSSIIDNEGGLDSGQPNL